MIQPIRTHPNKILRRRSREIEDLSQKEIHSHISDAIETMLSKNASSLSLIQIGIPLRIIVINCLGGRTVTLVNPRIIDQQGLLVSHEFCPSLPGRRISVHRYEYIRVEHEKVSGKEILEVAEPELAVGLQHEIDHLNGVLSLDRALQSN